MSTKQPHVIPKSCQTTITHEAKVS